MSTFHPSSLRRLLRGTPAAFDGLHWIPASTSPHLSGGSSQGWRRHRSLIECPLSTQNGHYGGTLQAEKFTPVSCCRVSSRQAPPHETRFQAGRSNGGDLRTLGCPTRAAVTWRHGTSALPARASRSANILGQPALVGCQLLRLLLAVVGKFWLAAEVRPNTGHLPVGKQAELRA